MSARRLCISAFEGELPYICTRWGNSTVKMLEEKLAGAEGRGGLAASMWPSARDTGEARACCCA